MDDTFPCFLEETFDEIRVGLNSRTEPISAFVKFREKTIFHTFLGSTSLKYSS